MDTEVVSINADKGTVQSITVKTKKGKQDIFGTHFISSIPLDELAQRWKPKLPPDIVDLSQRLTYRDELQVALFLKKTHITPDTWIYVHPKHIPFMRVMEMDNWSKEMSPPGTTSMVFEVACNKGDALWTKKDEAIIAMISKSFIEEFGLVTKKDIIGGWVHRMEKEYPVYHIGYREDVERIKNCIKQTGNIQMIGRNGTFRYNNMDHSIEMGLYAAWNILAGKEEYDIDSVNIEREYLEEKKIENLEDEFVEDDSIGTTS